MGYVSDIAERAKKSHRKEGKGESSAAERECSLPGSEVGVFESSLVMNV